jgi:hypothetical protein
MPKPEKLARRCAEKRDTPTRPCHMDQAMVVVHLTKSSNRQLLEASIS